MFGYRAAGAALLSNLSIERKQVVRWDPDAMKLLVVVRAREGQAAAAVLLPDLRARRCPLHPTQRKGADLDGAPIGSPVACVAFRIGE